jgi:hypothetical protein
MPSREIWLKTLTLLAVETGIIFSVVLLGLYLHFKEYFNSVLFHQRGILKIAFTTFICQFIFYLFDLYDISKPRLRRELLTDLFRAGGVVILVLGTIFGLRPTLLLGYLQEIQGKGVGHYANGVPIIAMILALGLMICWRLMIHWVMRHPRWASAS